MSKPEGGWNFGWPVAVAIIAVVGGLLVLASMNKLPSKVLNIVEWSTPSPPNPSLSENKPQLPNGTEKKVVPTPVQVSPPPKAENASCGDQLSDKVGRYEGKGVIINSPSRRSGNIVIDVSRETDTSCKLIARVEESSGLAGKGTLSGQFDPSVGQKVDLVGSLSHQSEPKVWDVEMYIQFISKSSIEGRSTWKPKSGIEDTKTYYEEFTATKPF